MAVSRDVAPDGPVLVLDRLERDVPFWLADTSG